MAAFSTSSNIVGSLSGSPQPATNVRATLTLRNGVKQQFSEKVSEGGVVPKLKNVREALKAVRVASQDAVNEMVEDERQSSNQQKNAKDGEESDYDDEEEDDKSENCEDEGLSGTDKNDAGGTNFAQELLLNLSNQPPEKRLKMSDGGSENKGLL
ncbi:uncharacterized protein LOC118417886 [Branchiostoma floridae]|uniref:Uncharacterized protein LOC118417886 n=1 Tax=Branchiostoma floridae TaxID=7739 RepID=C3ZXE9_BRAFL|nr:uncharacterized protein LOC118417886 [Branchiostoma floridae]|eukprot:XP_002586763.1 hypothetical protein BRAFLDRAFT_122858 [Branchiostoma floridae]